MHQVDKFVYFTSRIEEPSIIDCLVQAVAQRRLNQYESKTLEIVHRYLIVENRNLLLDTFNNFRQVLHRLDIGPPILNQRIVDGKHRGSRPRMADPHRDPIKHQNQMEKRARQRTMNFAASLQKYGITRDEFEQLLRDAGALARVESKVDAIRTSVDKNFAEVLKLIGLDKDQVDQQEVKKTLLKLVVNNTPKP